MVTSPSNPVFISGLPVISTWYASGCFDAVSGRATVSDVYDFTIVTSD
jgi:hypothetical protein